MISAQSKNAPTASASLPIGKYRLDMPIEGLTGLTEFSRFEYATFGREFDGEKDYNAPSLEFLKRRWKVALGTVKGRVFKIALYFDTDSKEAAVDASTDVMQLCQQWFGKAPEQHDTVFIWDASDGNVVVQFGKTMGTYQLNLFETSRTVKTFAPKR